MANCLLKTMHHASDHGIPATSRVCTLSRSLHRVLTALLIFIGSAVLAGCVTATGQPFMLQSMQVAAPASTAPDGGAYLLFNQRMIEAATQTELDITDVDAVFTRVFHGLPDEVIVYPSENYYYFVLHAGQRQIWGNIRLPAGAREQGELSFGYFEFVEFPWRAGEGLSGSKFYNADDGVAVTELDRFTYGVRYQGKEVIFHLHQLDQSPPVLFSLGADEVFVERTMDESGPPEGPRCRS